MGNDIEMAGEGENGHVTALDLESNVVPQDDEEVVDDEDEVETKGRKKVTNVYEEKPELDEEVVDDDDVLTLNMNQAAMTLGADTADGQDEEL
mmetsp:Transcript_52524/g.83651  ORF Transcript_52524/g.83651 Transcript_52524/m.83651 type:complete len:93 (+) Transcript_52524:1-279(+)